MKIQENVIITVRSEHEKHSSPLAQEMAAKALLCDTQFATIFTENTLVQYQNNGLF